MRLIKLKLKDYRRFAGEQSLDLNEDLIALVGPNEAGKSSILTALDLVGGLAMPGRTDTTRGLPGPATISALFLLDADDRALLTQIHNGSNVTHVWVEMAAGRDRTVWRPEPYPERDLDPRKRCREQVESLDGDPALDARFSASPELQWDPQLLIDVLTTLASTSQTLTSDAIASIESLAQRLRAIEHPPTTGSEDDAADESEQDRERAMLREFVASALVELAGLERQSHPSQLVTNALNGRTPDIAFFREADRELQSTYNLSEIADNPPPALRNLCALAELDLRAVQADIANGRVPHVEAVFESANAKLKERFHETWKQSDVYPRLTTPLDNVMRVMVAVEGGTDYSFPEERSDGLRWFMALHAFLAARGRTEPILLVDEAETHLHYDAQADLVDALMSQRITKQVIYSTHSVGCLPPDLGCGIRVVLAAQDAERSRIANSYWSVDPHEDRKVGYTPLLFAMGARLLSLTIPRYGVIAEGPADAVLLPTLFRQATGVSPLPYRIVPGLSDVADADIGSLTHHAGKVVSLADGDSGGRIICDRLRSGGVPAADVFSLEAIRPDCTLEDLVNPEVLAAAINRELDTWDIGPLRVMEQDLPTTGRWNWLLQQGSKEGTPIERLSKPRVAQRVVDIGREASASATPVPLLSVSDSVKMAELHDALCGALGLQ